MPEGFVAIPCGVQARSSLFWQCVEDLERPPGWRVPARTARGSSPAANRNLLARQALEEGYEWVFWLDDDLEFRPDTLVRLLAHEVSAVVALSYRRQPPFEPLWLDACPGGGLQWAEVQDPALGLQRLAAATSGALLTHRSVLEAVGDPWWTLGQFSRQEWQDDIWFCTRLREEGLALYGDPLVRVGHTTDVSVWPVWQAGRWHTCLARGSVPFALIPSQPVAQTGPVAGVRQ